MRAEYKGHKKTEHSFAECSVFPYKDLGGDAEMALNIRKNAVAQGASLLDVPGAQGEAKTLSSGIRLMDCNVAPPDTAVVPQVVVEVVIVYTKRDLGLLRCHFDVRNA